MASGMILRMATATPTFGNNTFASSYRGVNAKSICRLSSSSRHQSSHRTTLTVLSAAAEWPGLGGGGGGDTKKSEKSGSGDDAPRATAKEGGKTKKKSSGGGSRGGGGEREREPGGGGGPGGGRRGGGGSSKRGRGRGINKNNNRGSSLQREVDVTADGSSAWRLFDVKLDLDQDPGKDSFEVTPELRDAAAAALGLPTNRKREDGSPLLQDGEGYGVRVVRKSCDARDIPPVFSYIVDVDDIAINSATVHSGSMKPLKIRARHKKCERVPPDWDRGRDRDLNDDAVDISDAIASPRRRAIPPPSLGDLAAPAAVAGSNPRGLGPGNVGGEGERVLVVGLGPAGLFAALALTEAGVPVTVVERGQAVERRGRDIGALFARRVLDSDSNLCYGEGGAGTWSDGKLTTRIGRNGDDVRTVLRALVEFGAPPEILVAGKPHLGTDRLVRILRNARAYLASKGRV